MDALEGLRSGWRAGERNTLILAWLLPVLMSSFANLTGLIQLGPWAIGLLLWLITRRALSGTPGAMDRTA